MLNSKIEEFAKLLYNMHRLANLTWLLNHNRNVTDKALFDYGQLTPFEKKLWIVFAELLLNNKDFPKYGGIAN